MSLWKKWIALFLCTILLSGCSTDKKEQVVLDPQSPVVVILWHGYNAYAKTEFDKLVSEFNETVGMESGIVVDSYNYGDAAELAQAVYSAANKKVGAEQLPDLFMAYSDTAYEVNKITPLVDLREYFTQEELDEYCNSFLEEGIWEDGSLKMLPVSKSTEILYLNQTDFEKFSKDTGVGLEIFSTWESMAEGAEKYYNWSGGKALFGINPFHYFMILSAAQLSEPAFMKQNGEQTFSFSKETAKKIWDLCYIPHIQGWYLWDGHFCSDGVKSGEVLAYLGSSAGAGYFPLKVTLDVDRMYPIECEVLPNPLYEKGRPLSQQRGAGMCMTQSDQTHQYAAAQFLKWFTQQERNVEFSIKSGYIPVKEMALEELDELLAQEEQPEEKRIAIVKKSLSTVDFMLKNREFFSQKPYDYCIEAQQWFNQSLFDKMDSDCKKLEERVANGEDRAVVIAELTSQESFEKWYALVQRYVNNILEKS